MLVTNVWLTFSPAGLRYKAQHLTDFVDGVESFKLAKFSFLRNTGIKLSNQFSAVGTHGGICIRNIKDLVGKSVCSKRAVNEMTEVSSVDISDNIAATVETIGSPLRSKFGVLMRLDHIVDPERVDVGAGSCVKAATANLIAILGLA